ncbi:MAG: hypothetical protein M3O34_18685, partial [Chloroflexota bacterium]|nr:hypothetical protein [Chloroflexota bacterium]
MKLARINRRAALVALSSVFVAACTPAPTTPASGPKAETKPAEAIKPAAASPAAGPAAKPAGQAT